MDRYCKRLIEVDLPIRRISDHAIREKSIRHGHISTLHVWWARRPLAACRAILCAALWPDPVDDLCPESFIDTARKQMLEWATENLKYLSADSFKQFVQFHKNPNKLDNHVKLRGALLNFIADFANWDNSTLPQYLKTSSLLTSVAYESMVGSGGLRPLVYDPFAGGGSIPLEALRVGADSFASDLNPIAVILNKIILEYITQYGNDLPTEVHKWGKWVREQAEIKLAKYYPKDNEDRLPIAYLWARTILSEAPGKDKIPIELPLIRSMWLSKKVNCKRALRWVKDNNGKTRTEKVTIPYADGITRVVFRPLLEIFEPKNNSDVESGTITRGAATCPVTGYTTPIKRVRGQLLQRGGGQMMQGYIV